MYIIDTCSFQSNAIDSLDMSIQSMYFLSSNHQCSDIFGEGRGKGRVIVIILISHLYDRIHGTGIFTYMNG